MAVLGVARKERRGTPRQFRRNREEIVRVIDALQMADKHGIACPANWHPSEEVIVPPPTTAAGAEERIHSKDAHVTDWYFSKKKVA